MPIDLSAFLRDRLELIREAIRANPVTKLALVLVGFGSAGSILLFFFKTPAMAGGILLGLFALAVVVVILGHLAKLDAAIVRLPAVIILWSITVSLVVLLLSGTSSLIIGWPIKAWQIGGQSTGPSTPSGLTEAQKAAISTCDDKAENVFARLACYENLPFKEHRIVQDKIKAVKSEIASLQ